MVFYPQRNLVVLDALDKTVGYKLLKLLAQNLFTDRKSLFGLGEADIAVIVDMVENAHFPLS